MDERYRRANCFGMSKNTDYLWIYDSRVNALFRCDDESDEAKLFIRLGSEGKNSQYNQIVEVGRKIVLIPDDSREITIVDVDAMSMEHIDIMNIIEKDVYSKDKLRLLNYVVEDEHSLYLCGYNYPLILRVDADNALISALIDFSEILEINSDSGAEFNGYIGQGRFVIGDKIYFPIMCEDAFLEYQKNVNKWNMIKLDINDYGYSSILKVGDYIWAQDGRCNKLFILDDNFKVVDKVVYGDPEDKSYDNFSLIDGKEKVFIVPKSGKKRLAYIVNKNSLDVCKWDKVNNLLECCGEKIMPYPVIRIYNRENIVYFITGHDLMYHEFDILNDYMKNKYIYIPENMISEYFKYTVENIDSLVNEKDVSFVWFLKQFIE